MVLNNEFVNLSDKLIYQKYYIILLVLPMNLRTTIHIVISLIVYNCVNAIIAL